MTKGNDLMINLSDGDKENVVNKIRVAYDEQIKYMGAQDDPTLFAWNNESLKFHIINTSRNDHLLISAGNTVAFAEKSFKDNVLITDATKETKNYDFENIREHTDAIKYLSNSGLLPNLSEIIPDSIFTVFVGSTDSISDLNMVATEIGKRFAQREYEHRNTDLNKISINSKIKLFNKSYYANRYHFKQILESINDQQFASELNDCLAAYEQDFWFVCAAGLGSVIEHLLYMSLQRLDDHYRESHTEEECRRNTPLKGLRTDPMKTDYIQKLKQFHPSFDSRTESHINSVFLLRNSIDHYNSGYSNKSICDLMLQGVADIYGNIYINS